MFDASAGAQADTVVGFSEGPDHLSFAGESTATENAAIASAQFNGGNTVLTFPTTSIVLVGVTHVDTGICSTPTRVRSARSGNLQGNQVARPADRSGSA